jgi:hypothetical protein
MIEFAKGTLTEEQLRNMTKNYLGIRYRTNKDESFEAYANAWTLIVDTCKWIKNKIIWKHLK